MRRSLRVYAAMTLWLAPASSHAADETLDDFLLDANESYVRMIIRVSGLTLARANAYLEVDGRQPLYCAPRQKSFTTDEYLDLLRTYAQVQNAGTEDSDTFPLYMLAAIIEKYPCPPRQ